MVPLLVSLLAAAAQAAGPAMVHVQGVDLCAKPFSPLVYEEGPGPVYCWTLSPGADNRVPAPKLSGYVLERDDSTGGLVAMRRNQDQVLGAASIAIASDDFRRFVNGHAKPAPAENERIMAEHRRVLAQARQRGAAEKLDAAMEKQCGQSVARQAKEEATCREWRVAGARAKCAELQTSHPSIAKDYCAAVEALSRKKQLVPPDKLAAMIKGLESDPKRLTAALKSCDAAKDAACRRSLQRGLQDVAISEKLRGYFLPAGKSDHKLAESYLRSSGEKTRAAFLAACDKPDSAACISHMKTLMARVKGDDKRAPGGRIGSAVPSAPATLAGPGPASAPSIGAFFSDMGRRFNAFWDWVFGKR